MEDNDWEKTPLCNMGIFILFSENNNPNEETKHHATKKCTYCSYMYTTWLLEWL